MLARNKLVLLAYTYGKACKVIFLIRHHTRMLCRFTADKCTARLNTAVCNTLDDLLNLFRIILATSNVIKEEKRLCT